MSAQTPGQIPVAIPTARDVAALRSKVLTWKRAGERVGVVPTMGALHAGHLSLVEAASRDSDRVVVTIFVNPRQFGRADDLAAYPRTENADREKLAAFAPDLLYAPSVDVMYPDGFATTVSVAGVSECLCGAHRPGHFDGVATVVAKLLLQTQADLAFFGEKDYQQLQVVRRMVGDLAIPVEIVGVPTVRDADGLALSSRNAYLTEEERRAAPALHRALVGVVDKLLAGVPASEAVVDATADVKAAGFRDVDYIEVRDSLTLHPVEHASAEARIFGAAWLGRARLIDNVPVRRR